MMQRNSGGRGGSGAMAKPPVFSGGSKPKPSAFAAAARGAYWRNYRACGIRYRECMKNHAAAMGGSATDGCSEFMPSGEDDSLEAFRCAACSCHRSFHRQEVVAENHHWTSSMVHPTMMSFGGGGERGCTATDSSSKQLKFNGYQSSGAGNHYRTSSMVRPTMMSFGRGGGSGSESAATDSFNVYQSSGAGSHHSTSSMVHPMMMSFNGNGGGGGGRGSAATDSSSKELKSFNVYQSVGAGNHHSTSCMVHPMMMSFGESGGGGGESGSAATGSTNKEMNFSGAAPPPQVAVAKKRHRTKFSAEQKEKMVAFAEKIRWWIPKEGNDAEVQRFCDEAGVNRHAFKVWMQNNFKNLAKKTTTP